MCSRAGSPVCSPKALACRSSSTLADTPAGVLSSWDPTSKASNDPFNKACSSRDSFRLGYYTPHRGAGTGPAGRCGAPAGVPRYYAGPSPLRPHVPARTAGERPGRNSSGQRYWRPSSPGGSRRGWPTGALRHPESTEERDGQWDHAFSLIPEEDVLETQGEYTTDPITSLLIEYDSYRDCLMNNRQRAYINPLLIMSFLY